MILVLAVLMAALLVFIWTGLGLLQACLESQRRRRALLAYFAYELKSGAEIAPRIAVEAEWVAARRLGYENPPLKKMLTPKEQAELIEETEAVVRVGETLVREGFLSYFEPVFGDRKGKDQKIKAPRSLFLLQPKGEAEVKRMMVTA